MIFAGKAESQPLAFNSVTTLVSSSLAYKYKTGVEATDSGKHSSLSRYGSNYGRKNFYSKGPLGEGYEIFILRALRMFVIS
jgi:hypothetical protein